MKKKTFEDEEAKEEEGSDEKLIQITGLWLNEDKNGNPYFTGYMGNAKILIFKNKYKEEDKQPDYIMSIGANKKKTKKDVDDVTF